MIDRLVQEAAETAPESMFLVCGGRSFSYGEAWGQITRLAGVLQERGIDRLAFHARDSPELVVLLCAAARAGAEVTVIDRNSTPDEVAGMVERFHFGVIVSDVQLAGVRSDVVDVQELFDATASRTGGATPECAADSRLMILTTGTTGPPKGAIYTWSRLVRQARRKPQFHATRWLLAYHLNHFAGMQMLVHTLVNRACLVIPEKPTIADAADALVAHAVECVSATPTFWRFLVARCDRGELRKLPLRQITLGGEASSGSVLDLLRDRFPSAEISHVFATTEHGSCFSVRDREQGFPASVLSRSSGANVQLKIIDRELHVRSSNGMLGYYGEELSDCDAWRPTGDLVDIRGERIHFVGRKSEVINVGGVKVHPLPIEDLISEIPDVQLVHVYGKSNPIAGRIVAVDVVPAPGADSAALKSAIRESCRSLASHAQPRLIRIVEEVDLKNRKIVRRTP